ncbi:acyltransferase [Blastococcus goldschmidtiae]|uniref:acyltransferase n=1 Tax=Blastococcus goldschmidtiae TaxID=3075546 RepID=UPI0037BE5649
MMRASFGRKGARAVAGLSKLGRPSAWIHALRVLEFYADNNVNQKKLATHGTGFRLSPLASLRDAHLLTVGKNVRVGERACLWCASPGGAIDIGDDVIIAPGVMITTSNYGNARGALISSQDRKIASVLIGNDVWLGYNSVILPGVTVGDGCIVGANAVVVDDLEPGGIYGGIPARRIGSRE